MKIQSFSIIAGTTNCNASCPYCISKMTPKEGMCSQLNKINWRNFRKSCVLAQTNKVTSVIITGKGEPTLYPEQITQFLENLATFEFPVIELQTNALLLEESQYLHYLKKWYALGLTIISISITHYSHKKNKELIVQNSNYINLENVIKKLHELGFSVRLSCTMIRGYIDNVNEVKEMINYAKNLKVEQLSLRKLAYPYEAENSDILNWTKKHIIKKKEIDKITNFLEKNAHKLMTLENGSVVYDLNGQNVSLTDALSIMPKSDNLRQIIFFPDGHLRFDWQFGGATLI